MDEVLEVPDTPLADPPPTPVEMRLLALAADARTPYWACRLIATLRGCDPVDVIPVLKTLAMLFELRADEILGRDELLQEVRPSAELNERAKDAFLLATVPQGTAEVRLWQGHTGRAMPDANGDPVLEGAWYICVNGIIRSGPLYPLEAAAAEGARVIRSLNPVGR